MAQPYPPEPAYRFESSTTVKVVAWIVAVLSSLYMLPWAIAATRNLRNLRNHWTIFWIDLLLGWTILGLDHRPRDGMPLEGAGRGVAVLAGNDS